MKPTRGLSNSWLSHMPRERKVALGSLAFLVVLLVSLVLYQRFGLSPKATESQQPPVVHAPAVPQEAVAGSADVAGKANTVPQAAPQQLERPLSGRRQVLQGYGYMYSKLFADYRLHPGVDYAAVTGESVLAAATGKVIRIEDDPVDGRVLELDHGGGMVTRYGGLGEMSVGLNATVQAGSVIGLVGAEERPHLHFAVLLNGVPVDPALYVRP